MLLVDENAVSAKYNKVRYACTDDTHRTEKPIRRDPPGPRGDPCEGNLNRYVSFLFPPLAHQAVTHSTGSFVLDHIPSRLQLFKLSRKCIFILDNCEATGS